MKNLNNFSLLSIKPSTLLSTRVFSFWIPAFAGMTVLLSAPVYPQPVQLDDVTRLDALLAGIETLSAEVEQVIVEADGGVLETSSIRMHLQRPGGFYWETIEPFPELIVTDGSTLWNYQPDLEQVVIEDWDSASEELAAQLLNGRVNSLQGEYDIRLIRPEGEGNDGDSGTAGASLRSEAEEFLLLPQAADSPYSQINLGFLSSELDFIYLRSKDGQRTIWRFHSVVRNTALPPDTFTFTPPEGIEVIRNTYTQ